MACALRPNSAFLISNKLSLVHGFAREFFKIYLVIEKKKSISPFSFITQYVYIDTPGLDLRSLLSLEL